MLPKKNHILIICCALLFVAVGSLGISYAINITSDGYQIISLQTKNILLADTSCRSITNDATNRFIPTKTMAEWNSFNAVAASRGVSIGSCVVPVNGVCNNAIQFACSVGTSIANNAGSCGGNSTWSCQGLDGGTTASCSMVNIPTGCPAGMTYDGISCHSGFRGKATFYAAYTDCINTFGTPTLGGGIGSRPIPYWIHNEDSGPNNQIMYRLDGCGGGVSCYPPSGNMTTDTTALALNFNTTSCWGNGYTIAQIFSSAHTVSCPSPYDGTAYYSCNKAPACITAGTCGTANGKTYAYTDTTYGSDTQCAAGNGIATNISFPAQGGSVTWTCGGSGGGASSPTCSASRGSAPVNGVCGSATNTPISTTTYSWLPVQFSFGGCNGPPICNAGSIGQVHSDACTALPRTCTAVVTTSSTPSSNLCTTGTPSIVTGSGPWSWTCNGAGGGSNASCSTIPDSTFSSCTSVGQILSAGTTYPGCNTPDKVICTGNGVGYVLSMCNLGTTVAGTSASSYGSVYQWGRNNTTFTLTSSYPFDWQVTQNDNSWGGATTTIYSGTYKSVSSADKSLMQGPCASGYHVPTAKEWCDVITSISPGISCYPSWQPNSLVASTLLMPLAGYKDPVSGSMVGVGGMSPFWTSTPESIYSLIATVDVPANGIYPYGYMSRAGGASIRCAKN